VACFESRCIFKDGELQKNPLTCTLCIHNMRSLRVDTQFLGQEVILIHTHLSAMKTDSRAKVNTTNNNKGGLKIQDRKMHDQTRDLRIGRLRSNFESNLRIESRSFAGL